MAESKPKSVLDEEVFPIMGWPGPSGEIIRDDVMRDMAEAGFTLSLSSPSPGRRLEALDVAHRNGIRLVLQDPAYHVGDDYKLTPERRREIEKIIDEVKGHPGLYGYHLRDEPRVALLPTIAEVKEFMSSLDPYHLMYVNHFRFRQSGFGAGSIELFWRKYISQVKPQFLSYDHYCITVVSQQELDNRDPTDFTYLPQHKIRVARSNIGWPEDPNFFVSLDMCRNLSLFYNLPFWTFTCSVGHGPYPTPTEGHIRFQLMHDLAYGARGLQYFTYNNGGLIDRKGERTETWYVARKVNREIHTWAPTLRRLTSTAVYHHGPSWSGARVLKPDGGIGQGYEHHTVGCDGDPVTVGFFQDPDEVLHLLVVNKNPCDWARTALMVKLAEREEIFEVTPSTGRVRKPWPYNRERLELVFAPGEGRLFRVAKEP